MTTGWWLQARTWGHHSVISPNHRSALTFRRPAGDRRGHTISENQWDVAHLAAGDELHVQVFKEGGRPFRTWTTAVEQFDPGWLITWSPPGHLVRTLVRPGAGDDPGMHEWHSPWGIRNYYWAGRPYNLLELFHPDGRLEEIYVHVAGPPTVSGRLLTWTDYELDVVVHPGGVPVIIDEDEFAEAVVAYGYSPEFQAACYQIARDAVALLLDWTPGLPPTEIL